MCIHMSIIPKSLMFVENDLDLKKLDDYST